MLATLALWVCLNANPNACELVRPDKVPGPMQAQECILLGQRIAAEWANEHPAYRVVKVRCTLGPHRDPLDNGQDA